MIDQQSLDQINKVISDVSKNGRKLFLTKWWIIWPTLTAIFLAWVPFYGYFYLLGKLDALGFEAADVSPKVYDLIIYFLLGISDFVSVLYAYRFLGFTKSFIVPTIGIGILSLIGFFWWSGKSKITTADNMLQKSDPLTKLLALFARSIIRNAVLIVGLILSLLANIILVWLSIVLLILVPWLIAFSGYVPGKAAGEAILESPICVSYKSNEDFLEDHPNYDRNYFLGCSELSIEGKGISGRRVYVDENSIFFVSNTASYQVSHKGEILYFRPITRLDNSSDAKDD